jgi:hypothetical protein
MGGAGLESRFGAQQAAQTEQEQNEADALDWLNTQQQQQQEQQDAADAQGHLEGNMWVAPDGQRYQQDAEGNWVLMQLPGIGDNGGYAQGGIAQGMYLGGATDGMADSIPATIGGGQQAALSDGEFVVPADVVSHLGNGNSEAGAQHLYGMMDQIRTARTGNPNQGKQIDPNKFTPGSR